MGDAYLTDAELDELRMRIMTGRFVYDEEIVQRLIAEVKELRARGRK